MAASVAIYLVAPPVAEGFELAGWRLSTAQRDFRVFNNFTDPEANDNQTPDPSFPGRLGAEMAIWKGCVEWGSELHGDGSGDPHQPGDLGSGGANFDASFQGTAGSSGAIGDNTHSELPGCSGGTIAFTEAFLNGDGWRIFYYECWLWVDGPEENWPNGTGKYDLQGIATHEYGHALGLGHSDVVGSTMQGPPIDSGRGNRSLAPDDIAGVQVLYGVKDLAKPRISGLSYDGLTLTITGVNFHPSDNEVWFTRGSGSGNGDPIKQLHVPSTGGTQIDVALPGEAGSGDVLVKNDPGAGGSTLSNAWPLDVNACPPPTNYCTTTPNSVGPGAEISASGSTSVSANDLVLHSAGSPPSQFGIFFYSPTQDSKPVGNGTLCLGGPFFRLPAVATNPQGQASHALDLTSPPKPGGQVLPGSTWNFQWWYRDPAAGGAAYSFSDALQVGFCD